MASFDVMPWQSPLGGTVNVVHVRLNAAESFRIGEPVSINADAELTESADDPVAADLFGIAMASGDTTVTTDAPSASNIVTGRTYPASTATGVAVTGDMIPVALPSPNSYFITRNFGVTSEAFDQDLTIANIGDEAGLELVSGVWGINVGATNNTCRIIDLLDANKTSVQRSGGTVAYVVFQIVAHQSMPVTGVAEAPAA